MKLNYETHEHVSYSSPYPRLHVCTAFRVSNHLREPWLAALNIASYFYWCKKHFPNREGLVCNQVGGGCRSMQLLHDQTSICAVASLRNDTDCCDFENNQYSIVQNSTSDQTSHCWRHLQQLPCCKLHTVIGFRYLVELCTTDFDIGFKKFTQIDSNLQWAFESSTRWHWPLQHNFLVRQLLN